MFDFNDYECSGRSSNYVMLDLHGLSPESAKIWVNHQIALAQEKNITEFRFVTGRGNHENSRGKRGTLYKEFSSWITPENRSKIASIVARDGYYEIYMKPFTKKQGIFSYLLDNLVEESISEEIGKIKELAERGDADHQYSLGCCYQAGYIMLRDEKMAVYWFEKAAHNGNHMAAYRLAGCYWQGRGVRQNDKKAIQLFEASALQGNSLSCEVLGDCYNLGDAVKVDYTKAFNYYERAANLGLERARRKLADAYFYGKGIQKDEKKAFELYKIASDAGNAHAAYNLACCYLYAVGTEKDIVLAIKYATQSANQHDSDSQYLLFQIYYGETFTDQEKAFKYLEESANNQNKYALFTLASRPKILIDKKKYSYYMLSAARAGHSVAQAIVLRDFSDEELLEYGLGQPEKNKIKENLWRQSNEYIYKIVGENHDDQMSVLIAFLSNDSFTKKQRSKLLELLQHFSDKGNLEAILILGKLYFFGEKIVDKNVQKAKTYWLKGADLGCSECLIDLAHFHMKGFENKGVPDYKSSVRCYEEAAKRDNSKAHYYLGCMYANQSNKEGVKIDITLSISHLKASLRLEFSSYFPELNENESAKISKFSDLNYRIGTLYMMLLSSSITGFPQSTMKVDELIENATKYLSEAKKWGHSGCETLLEQLSVLKSCVSSDSNSQTIQDLWLAFGAALKKCCNHPSTRLLMLILQAKVLLQQGKGANNTSSDTGYYSSFFSQKKAKANLNDQVFSRRFLARPSQT